MLVLEQSRRPGGGARTDETVPGYRFDTHSVAHNLINMTDVPSELRLAEAGLDYVEMDPFSTAVFADGEIVRLHRSVERTVESIGSVAPEDTEPYRRLMADGSPLVHVAVAGIDVGGRAGRRDRGVAGSGRGEGAGRPPRPPVGVRAPPLEVGTSRSLRARRSPRRVPGCAHP
ncbi:MAG: hypothetical protein ACRDYX_15985 [Egibacteraceae bacterium]